MLHCGVVDLTVFTEIELTKSLVARSKVVCDAYSTLIDTMKDGKE